MWECPIMAHLTNAAPTDRAWEGKQLQRHMFSVSPDYCVNMIQYWLGDYADGKFDMEGAGGTHKLDLGDVMYAPNVLTDEHVSVALIPLSQQRSCRLHGSQMRWCWCNVAAVLQ
jgi:sucrose-6-phosphate hydrolase SacC (GH32 family)